MSDTITNPTSTDESVKLDESGNPVAPVNPDTEGKSDETTETAETVLDPTVLDYSDETAIKVVYGEADQSGKARIRAHITKLSANVLKSDDALKSPELAIGEWKRLNALLDSLKTLPSKSVKEYDFGQIVAYKAFVLNYARSALLGGIVDGLPEGVELDTEDIRAKYDAMIERHESTSTNDPDQVDFLTELLESVKPYITVKLGQKAGKRDITGHIAHWAQTVPSGTFATLTEIAKFRSDEYNEAYSGNNPSTGAIAAHLFPTDKDGKDVKYDKSDSSFVVPVARNGDKARGARTV